MKLAKEVKGGKNGKLVYVKFVGFENAMPQVKLKVDLDHVDELLWALRCVKRKRVVEMM
jgi:hypothetical protein